jgi:HEAT repeat protein
LGAYKDPRLIDFIKQRYKAEQSYLVKASAITALGHYNDPALIDFITQAAKTPSPREVLEKAAKAALKKEE